LSDGSAITVTADHPFWLDGGLMAPRAGWIQAGDLVLGDRLRTPSGQDVAVRGLLHVATAALPPMERRGGGDIVVIAPVAGHVLRGGAGDLGSARIALEIAALCDNLRWRGGSRGARVAVVEPGAVVVEAGVSGAGSQPATQDGASWAPLHARCGPVHMTAFQPCLWA